MHPKVVYTKGEVVSGCSFSWEWFLRLYTLYGPTLHRSMCERRCLNDGHFKRWPSSELKVTEIGKGYESGFSFYIRASSQKSAFNTHSGTSNSIHVYTSKYKNCM